MYGNKSLHAFDNWDNVKLISRIVSRMFLKYNGWVTQQRQERGVCPAGFTSVGWFKTRPSSWRGWYPMWEMIPSVWKPVRSCQASFSCYITPGVPKWQSPLMLCFHALKCAEWCLSADPELPLSDAGRVDLDNLVSSLCIAGLEKWALLILSPLRSSVPEVSFLKH